MKRQRHASSQRSVGHLPLTPAGDVNRPVSAPPMRVQALRMIRTVTCEPVPFDVTLDHEASLVWSGTINGPAGHGGDLVNDAFESLATIPLRIGADGLYSIRLNTAADCGWMFVTATATATVPCQSQPLTGWQRQ